MSATLIFTPSDFYKLYSPHYCQLRLYLSHKGAEPALPGYWFRLGARHEKRHFDSFSGVATGGIRGRSRRNWGERLQSGRRARGGGNEQVKRNKNRFLEDFMFQLTIAEKAEVVANCDHLSQLKFSPVRPFAFTEHGAIMAASVLNTQRAADVSIYVVRAFVRLREMLSTHKELARKWVEMEDRIAHHDGAIRTLIDAIKQLMKQPEPREKKIGFIKESRAAYRSSGKR